MIRNFLISFVIILGVALAGCTSQEKSDFRDAQKAIDQGHFRIAMNLLDRVVKRNQTKTIVLEAAREASRISFYEVKDYKKAAEFFRFVVLHSPDADERLQAQKQIASIYFDSMQDYQNAVNEFGKLLEMPHNPLEENQYRMSLARAYFYLGNYFQALSEIEMVLNKDTDENTRFSAYALRGNILVAQKQFGKAAEAFKLLIQSYPERAMKENIGMSLAACYEENNDFKSAVKILEEYRGKYKSPEYIDLRIKRLQERLKNAPGAKGFRK